MKSFFGTSNEFLFFTLSPLARLMARNGLNTRNTRRILTTEIASELCKNSKNHTRISNEWIIVSIKIELTRKRWQQAIHKRQANPVD